MKRFHYFFNARSVDILLRALICIKWISGVPVCFLQTNQIIIHPLNSFSPFSI